MSARQLSIRAILGARVQPRQSGLPLCRAYHQTATLRTPSKDDSGEDLKPWRSENTQSGYDQQAAEHQAGAFNPKITRPEEAKESVQSECNGSPLEFSGANRDVSQTTDESLGNQDDHKRNKSSNNPGKKHGHLKPKSK
ncbi:hypothetical protein QBC47DRAFT_381131 [Echria macrotheca]|uniref:Uncharacterized protein n=1 Tax=Echria macrotheca TaxID=438768 RepID=A0AAJ0BCF9_9PEZI|nr:hypothetical protein QBC47DRAFT_381131 [Echria macrotheca]